MGIWNTTDELDFIKRIGTFRTKPGDRRSLLAGYLLGCETRTNWDKLDKKAVIDYAMKELQKEIGKDS